MHYCDLHVHTNYSDGTCTPRQVVELAVKAGLKAVALCDHNTVAGVPEFLEAADRAGIEGIAGVEYSSEFEGKELHILGLFIEPANYEAVAQVGDRYLVGKEQSNVQLCRALCGAGLDLDYEKIKAATADGFVNRAVIGRAMVAKGYVQSVEEAFNTWLSEKRGYYVPPYRPDALEIIRFIKSIGAVAVLAHPLLQLKTPEQQEAFLEQAAQAGLDAMEVCYSKYDEQETAQAMALAERFGLLPSGGSDFHGATKPDIAIGVGRGNLKIPYAWAQKIKMKKM